MAAKNSDKLEPLLQKTRVLRDKIIYSAGGQSKKAVEKLHEEEVKMGEDISNLINSMETDAKELSVKEIDVYQDALNQLNMANMKKLQCLQTRMQVCELESLVWNVSCFVTKMSVMLVQAQAESKEASTLDDKLKKCALKADNNVPGYIGRLSQNCIFGLADNWSSIEVLNKCGQVHVQNAANFHKFHTEVKEYKLWMLHDLSDAFSNFEKLNMDKPTSETILFFLSEFEAVHKALMHWRCTLGKLATTASSLVPVDLRTSPVDTPLPVTALASYTAQNMIIREGEMLTLIEGGEAEHWKVSNLRGVVAQVPSNLILIPPPHPPALKTLDELNFILLTYWTKCLKLYGSRYIKLLLVLYKEQYGKEELRQLERLEEWDKENILTYFISTEEVLKKFWSSSRMYQHLLERVGVLRVLLEDDADMSTPPSEEIKTTKEFDCMINATPHLSDITNLYEELIAGWECYKTRMDMQHHPELMLSLQQWTQLQYLPSQKVSQFWQKILWVDEYDTVAEVEASIEGEKVTDTLAIQTVTKETSSQKDGADSSSGDADALLLHVIDPLQREKVLKKAVIEQQQAAKITQTITTDQGAVLKRPKEETITKTTSSSTGAGKDVVDGSMLEQGSSSLTTEAETEKITSEDSEVKQTFTISSVVDPHTNKEISLDDAILKGVIIPEQGIYKDLTTGETTPIQVAMSKNLIKVTMTSKKSTKTSNSSLGLVTIKSLRQVDRPYKVISVKDTKSEKNVELDEAVKQNLLDLKKGLVLNTATEKRISVKEAVKSGLVEVEYTAEQPEPEEVIKRYAVRAVIDKKNKKTVTFEEAIQQGIIHSENGYYTDTVTGEKINIGEAIARGFLKARQVNEDDLRHLDFNSANQVTIDRTKTIRKKLIQPLAAIGALRKLGTK